MNYRRAKLWEYWWFGICNLIYTDEYMAEVWMPKNGFRFGRHLARTS